MVSKLKEVKGYTDNPIEQRTEVRQETEKEVVSPPSPPVSVQPDAVVPGEALGVSSDPTPVAPDTTTDDSLAGLGESAGVVAELIMADEEQPEAPDAAGYMAGYTSLTGSWTGNKHTVIIPKRSEQNIQDTINNSQVALAVTGYQSVLPTLTGRDPEPVTAEPVSVSPSDLSWLRYSNQQAVRSQPINEKLVAAMSFLPELGITMEVFSGGQPAKGTSDKRVGSVRHDHGNAADVFFYKDGRKLNWANRADVPIFQEIIRRARANGVTGFGAGPGYMREGSMHIGFGTEAVWGAGGSRSNAPDWLVEAFYS